MYWLFNIYTCIFITLIINCPFEFYINKAIIIINYLIYIIDYKVVFKYKRIFIIYLYYI